MSLATLLVAPAEAWSRATTHPFLVAVRDGTLPPDAFDAWLVEDHQFVSDLLWFQSRLLARAPRSAQAVLAAGAVALVAELDWFETVAAERGLRLGGEPDPATSAYADLLSRLDSAPVPEALVALWAVERVYLDAWSFAAPGALEYREFVAHWTAPEFAAYTDALEQAADASGGSDPAVVQETMVAVAEAEVRFWDMAWSHVE